MNKPKQPEKNAPSTAGKFSMHPGLTLTAVIFLLLPFIFNFPYGFYKLLRLVICGYFVYSAWLSYQKSKISFSFIVSSLFALLFNPFARIGFKKDEWLTIDGITVLVIIVLAGKDLLFFIKDMTKKNND